MNNTIKQAILALKSKISDSYTAVSNKGGILPPVQNSSNLPEAIASIPTSSVTVNPGYVTTLQELSAYAKVCDVYGAVLSKETEGEHTGKYIIWNDVPGEQTWDPRGIGGSVPTGHGTNKAVCVGEGMWLIVGWKGLTNMLSFANLDTNLYSDLLVPCIKGSGKSNSDYILEHYCTENDAETQYPLWYSLKLLREENNGELNNAYIPDYLELLFICRALSDSIVDSIDCLTYTTNIAKIFETRNSFYVSSTQSPATSLASFVFYVYFWLGTADDRGKNPSNFSFACLSFD